MPIQKFGKYKVYNKNNFDCCKVLIYFWLQEFLFWFWVKMNISGETDYCMSHHVTMTMTENMKNKEVKLETNIDDKNNIHQ